MASLPQTFVENFHDEDAVKKMIYRDLGGTGLKVSALGFGGSALGGVFHAVTEEECTKVVRETLRAGVNIIDTAPWYGQGKSEEMLGKALKGIPRQAYILNTKVGRYDPAIDKMFDFTAERVTQSVDESLGRLGVDYIDIIQVHDVEFAPNVDIILNGTLPALEKLKAAGKVKMIGITGYSVSCLQEILQRSSVKIDTVLSYSRLTLMDSSLLSLLPHLKSKQVGLLNAAPTGMGLLTRQGPPAWHPASEQIKERCSRAAKFCQERNVDITSLSLKFCLQDERLPTTFISFATLQHMEVAQVLLVRLV